MSFRHVLMCLAVAASLLSPPDAGDIIRRHDVSDQRYLDFASSLDVTNVAVRYNRTDMAGMLVAPTWVLSAAHVAETLTAGDTLLAADDSALRVKRVVLHPGWVENGRPEDIALIELVDALEVDPIPGIYRTNDEAGREVVIIGNGDFGTGMTGPSGNDGRFRAATNRVDQATGDYLVWAFEHPEDDPEGVTAMEGISGPGDSAGPALIRQDETYWIAGISSGQSTQATGGREGLYGVTEYYTRVSAYVEWIDRTIAMSAHRH